MGHRLLSILLTLGTLASALSAQNALESALERAGANREPLTHFIEVAEARYGDFGKRGATFLVEGMPDTDLTSLDSEFLIENLGLAIQARNEFAWAKDVPETLFFNDVLPYASLDETREAWRAEFLEMARPIVASSTSATEAVQALNKEFFNHINVHYNTGRKRPNQSPSESIEQSRATCTGLSIILVDACRAVGIPARVVGTPLWTNMRGNHTWSEVWDGEWYFTGSDEFDAKGLNRGWFVNDASKALEDEPRHAIYASTWQPTGTFFPMVWARRSQNVAAVNVTARYAKGDAETDADDLYIRVREAPGAQRLEVTAELLNSNFESLATKLTKAGRADMNDITGFTCDPNQPFFLRMTDNGVTKMLPILRSVTDPVTLDIAWSAIPSEEETKASQLAGLRAYLATPESARPPVIPDALLNGTLSEDEAAEAIAMLYRENAASEREQRAAEMEAKAIGIDGKELRFLEKRFGDAPEGERSLWISMHGGGNAPARVNDRQWQNQISLYEPEEGFYVAPRAPTDTWNLWHEAHIDPLFDRLIENYVLLHGVNPNKVYLMGYSAGGDGVYQLAPRMADRFAAAAMMAGHPNETQPFSLRNLPFALFMGGEDAAYSRNEVAAKWRDWLQELSEEDVGGYRHFVRIYPGLGHWMQRNDAEALPWMAAFDRDPWPAKIVWYQDDVTHTRFYWLAVPADQAAGGRRVDAQVNGQTITVDSDEVTSFTLRLSDALMDLDQPIQVVANGETRFEGVVPRSIRAIETSLTERADATSVATALLNIRL